MWKSLNWKNYSYSFQCVKEHFEEVAKYSTVNFGEKIETNCGKHRWILNPFVGQFLERSWQHDRKTFKNDWDWGCFSRNRICCGPKECQNTLNWWTKLSNFCLHFQHRIYASYGALTIQLVAGYFIQEWHTMKTTIYIHPWSWKSVNLGLFKGIKVHKD